MILTSLWTDTIRVSNISVKFLLIRNRIVQEFAVHVSGAEPKTEVGNGSRSITFENWRLVTLLLVA